MDVDDYYSDYSCTPEDLKKLPWDVSLKLLPDKSKRKYENREMKIPIDDLDKECSWSSKSGNCSVILEGLQLEGASLAGNALTANTADSPDVTTVPPITMYWIAKNKEEGIIDKIVIPLYLSADRDITITELKIPSRASEHNKWILAGTAFYISS